MSTDYKPLMQLSEPRCKALVITEPLFSHPPATVRNQHCQTRLSSYMNFDIDVNYVIMFTCIGCEPVRTGPCSSDKSGQFSSEFESRSARRE